MCRSIIRFVVVVVATSALSAHAAVTVVEGLNTYTGSLGATPPSQLDTIDVIVPAGLEITGVFATSDAEIGFIEFGVQSTTLGTLNLNFLTPLLPGTYTARFGADFNTTTTAWTLNVVTALEGSCVPTGELCSDGLDTDCDFLVDCDDDDCDADPVCMPSLINYSELDSGDLGSSVLGPEFVVDAGVNVWTGRIEATPPSKKDAWVIVVKPGLEISEVHATGPASDGGANFAGFMSFENVSDTDGTLDKTYLPHKGPGKYLAMISTDFNTGFKNWTFEVTVVEQGVCVPGPEICANNFDDDCDGDMDCDDSDCDMDAVCGPVLYDQMGKTPGLSNIRSHSGHSSTQDAEAADDFEVPDTVQDWTIDRVTVRSVLEPEVNINVFIRADNNGKPGTDVCANPGITSADYVVVHEQDFSKRTEVFIAPCLLTPGTYWLSVQGTGGIMDFQFNWESSGATIGANAQFRTSSSVGSCGGSLWQEAAGCINPLINNSAEATAMHFALSGTFTEIVCIDDDMDGYGNPGEITCAVPSVDDCDDTDPTINPGMAELCANGIDDDCDLLVDCDDTAECDPCGVDCDMTDPTVDCAGVAATANTDPDTCDTLATATQFDPSVTDDCPGSSATNDYNGMASLAGETLGIGTTEVEWTATDGVGNTAVCTVDVIITDAQDPQIACPLDVVKPTDAGICSAIVNYAAPTSSDNCPGASTTLTAGLGSGSAYPLGSTIDTHKVTDDAGHTASCSLTIDIVDEEQPSIQCPASMTVPTDPGACHAVVNYAVPAGDDNCPGVSTLQASGLGSGGTFPLGDTLESYETTDAVALMASCSFVMTVEDQEQPLVSCTDQLGIEPTSVAGTIVAYTPVPQSGDNCDGPLAVACNIPSGSQFAIGTHNVTCTAVDSANNTGTCVLSVEILSPVQVLETIESTIASLVSNGDLGGGPSTGLMSTLSAAITKINNGQHNPACSLLNAFIEQTNAFENGGHISPSDAQALIDSAINAGLGQGCTNGAFAP
jgi:hypothetical protein